MKDLSIFQTVIYIGFIIKTKTPCPRVYVSLVTNDVLRTEINYESTLFYLNGKVIWPGRINVDKNGTVQIQFNKEVHENWPNPIATPYSNKSFPLSRKWGMELIANEPIGSMISLMSFAYVARIYHYVYPTDQLQIIGQYEGIERAFWFVPVPMMPLRDLFYPNVAPGMWRSLGESIQLVANSRPFNSFSSYISKRGLGCVLTFSGPITNFCPWVLNKKSKFYFIATTTGIRHVLSTILWILQTNLEATVGMLIFGRVEGDVMFPRELVGIKVASNGRFTYCIILSCPTVAWKGYVGTFSEKNIRKHIPDPQALDTLDDMEIILAGRSSFMNVTRLMLVEYGYPESFPRVFLNTPTEFARRS